MRKSSVFNSPWAQSKKLLIASIVGIIAIAAVITVLIVTHNSHSPSEPKETSTLFYETRYYDQFGSRGVRIYGNGEVFEDIESENPNHKPDYKYVKTLTDEQIEDLTVKKSGELTDDEYEKYVKKIVYGD